MIDDDIYIVFNFVFFEGLCNISPSHSGTLISISVSIFVVKDGYFRYLLNANLQPSFEYHIIIIYTEATDIYTEKAKVTPYTSNKDIIGQNMGPDVLKPTFWYIEKIMRY